MTTRADIAATALAYNGFDDGVGYPGPLNIFEQLLGQPDEFWCAVFVSAIFKMCNLPLPVMQVGMPTGFASVPLGWQYAQDHGAAAPSWDAEVADLAIFANDVSPTGHVEIVYAFNGTQLYTIGGDSGPSNIDGYTGQGGVHVHESYIQPGVGNSQIAGVIQTGHLVTFTNPPPSKESEMFRFRDSRNGNIYLYPTITHLDPVSNTVLDKSGVCPLLLMPQVFVLGVVKNTSTIPGQSGAEVAPA
jgi:hypothetical protein